MFAEHGILLANAQLPFVEAEKETNFDFEVFDMLTNMCMEKHEEWIIRTQLYSDELVSVVIWSFCLACPCTWPCPCTHRSLHLMVCLLGMHLQPWICFLLLFVLKGLHVLWYSLF